MFSHHDPCVIGNEYNSAEDAITEAKKRILNSFEGRGEVGYSNWFSFGEDVVILALNGAKEVDFSGQNFVKEICGISD